MAPVQAPWPLLHYTLSSAKALVGTDPERTDTTAQDLLNNNDYREARMHDGYK